MANLVVVTAGDDVAANDADAIDLEGLFEIVVAAVVVWRVEGLTAPEL